MGSFRFFRRLRIFPGLRLNFSKSGVSASIGPRGADVTVGHGRTSVNVGLPGTGLRWQATHVERTFSNRADFITSSSTPPRVWTDKNSPYLASGEDLDELVERFGLQRKGWLRHETDFDLRSRFIHFLDAYNKWDDL